MKTMPSSDALLVFDALARLGSFTAAADELDCAKSYVSQTIKRLEADLGAVLVLRTTRRVTLTETGQRLAMRAAQIRALMVGLKPEITGMQDQLAGPLFISSPSGIGQFVLAPILAEFAIHYPSLQVQMTAQCKLEEMATSGIDFCLHSRNVIDDGMVARPLGVTQKRLYASSVYLQRAAKLTHPCDLRQHRVFCHEGMHEQLGWQLEKAGEIVRVELQPTLICNTFGAIASAVEAGYGVGLLDNIVAAPYLRQGLIQSVLPEWLATPKPYFLVFPYRQPMPKKYEAFLQFVVPRLQARLSQSMN
jgi:LysR family transcriptional regulator, transcriptional activator for dmlA